MKYLEKMLNFNKTEKWSFNLGVVRVVNTPLFAKFATTGVATRSYVDTTHYHYIFFYFSDVSSNGILLSFY